MRLWSIHPRHLDAKGLVALWREGLLAQKVLAGETKGYRNHPQLDRFKRHRNPLGLIGSYLDAVFLEADRRGYHFDRSKIKMKLRKNIKIKVNSEQRDFELSHLKAKLKRRSRADFITLNRSKKTSLHPLFELVSGPIEEWERTD